MNDNLIDLEYICKITPQLEGCVKKRNDLWNARCPLCGDSKKNKFLKRFYIYSNNGHYSVKCHNCQYSSSFQNFLELYAPVVYQNYLLDKFPKSKTLENRFFRPKEVEKPKKPCLGFNYSCLINFNDLKESHPARLYVEKRQIPFQHVLYSPKFCDFVSILGIERYRTAYKNSKEPRLIIPFYREDGLSTVFQARSFSKKEKLRYITIKENDDEKKIFGLSRIDKSKTVYCTEGPIDSMMIPNSIAMSGISISLPLEVVYIYDNEPRNEDVVRTMKKKLVIKKSVVIMPDSVKEKDLNQMIVNGMSRGTLLDIIKNHTYSGESGILRLNAWSKVV